MTSMISRPATTVGFNPFNKTPKFPQNLRPVSTPHYSPHYDPFSKTPMFPRHLRPVSTPTYFATQPAQPRQTGNPFTLSINNAAPAQATNPNPFKQPQQPAKTDADGDVDMGAGEPDPDEMDYEMIGPLKINGGKLNNAQL